MNKIPYNSHVGYAEGNFTTPSPCLQRTQAVLQAVSAVQSGGSPSSDIQEALAAASSPVLRIIIDNMFYPVTLDVLQQVGLLKCCQF